MRKFLLSTALLGALSIPAHAQDLFLPSAQEGDVRASTFIGQRLYAAETPSDMTEADGAQTDWMDVGEVNDVFLSRDGTVDGVLVDIGGFLGMGEHRVLVDMSQVKFVADRSTADDPNDYFLVVTATEDALKAAPQYQDAAAPVAETAPADGTDTAATTETAPVEAAPAEAADPAATTSAMAPANDGFVAATPEQITAEALTGASVYDANDERVGEIAELILDADGNAQQAVVDVGGFLGIGEKPVALDMSMVKIMKAAESDELRVYVGDTKEQLEAMPTYEKG